MSMPRILWRGEWYVYHHRRREFLRRLTRSGEKRRPEAPDSTYALWTPTICRALAYKNPSAAQRAARRINAEIYRKDSAVYPCQPVSVVTGEAARCLDAINRRDT